MKIEEASQAIKDFVKKTLGRDAKIIKIAKSKDGWSGEAEVFEENSLIKALGLNLNTKVQDRNVYEIKLTDDLEVSSYGRKEGITKEE
ncbi:MAG: hypothetical protein KJ920_13185 [Actinobacteria bacterium]|nr:hypothetical protein [Actinomycetota bacterium]MCG2679395.1 hypothetical protein [Kiritimatiellia bacterium]